MIGHIVMFCGLLFSPQQSVDVVVPGSDLNPAGHCVQADAELFENVSAGHVEHDVAASCDWNSPAAQLVHAAEPSTLLNVPPAHSIHGPVPSGSVYPTLH